MNSVENIDEENSHEGTQYQQIMRKIEIRRNSEYPQAPISPGRMETLAGIKRKMSMRRASKFSNGNQTVKHGSKKHNFFMRGKMFRTYHDHTPRDSMNFKDYKNERKLNKSNGKNLKKNLLKKIFRKKNVYEKEEILKRLNQYYGQEIVDFTQCHTRGDKLIDNFDIFLSNNPEIRILRLCGNNITDSGAAKLILKISEYCGILEVLDLSENLITEKFLEILIRENFLVGKINLKGCGVLPLTSKTVKMLRELDKRGMKIKL